MLKHQPHAFDIVLGIAPVAQRVEVAQIKLVLHTLCDTGCCDGDLAGDESLSPALGLVIEEYSVDGEHPISLAIVLHYPETVLFRYAIRTARVERCSFLLRDFLHLAEQLGGGSLIDAASLLHAKDAYCLQKAQSTDRIRLGGVFRTVE